MIAARGRHDAYDLLPRLGYRWRQVGQLLRVGLVHARGETLLGELLGEHFAYHRYLVGIVDLITTETPADPGLGHALGIADGDALVLEGEIARRGGAGVEVLVEPHVRRHDQRADLPIVTLRRIALRPHQRVALAR